MRSLLATRPHLHPPPRPPPRGVGDGSSHFGELTWAWAGQCPPPQRRRRWQRPREDRPAPPQCTPGLHDGGSTPRRLPTIKARLRGVRSKRAAQRLITQQPPATHVNQPILHQFPRHSCPAPGCLGLALRCRGCPGTGVVTPRPVLALRSPIRARSWATDHKALLVPQTVCPSDCKPRRAWPWEIALWSVSVLWL